MGLFHLPTIYVEVRSDDPCAGTATYTLETMDRFVCKTTGTLISVFSLDCDSLDHRYDPACDGGVINTALARIHNGPQVGKWRGAEGLRVKAGHTVEVRIVDHEDAVSLLSEV